MATVGEGVREVYPVCDNDWHQQRASSSRPSQTYELNVHRRVEGRSGWADEASKKQGGRETRKQGVLYVKTISTIKITARWRRRGRVR